MEKNNYDFLDELDASLMEDISRGGRWVDIFKEFMRDNRKYCVISFKNKSEKTSCLCSLRKLKKDKNLDLTFGNYGPGIKIYIAKA